MQNKDILSNIVPFLNKKDLFNFLLTSHFYYEMAMKYTCVSREDFLQNPLLLRLYIMDGKYRLKGDDIYKYYECAKRHKITKINSMFGSDQMYHLLKEDIIPFIVKHDKSGSYKNASNFGILVDVFKTLERITKLKSRFLSNDNEKEELEKDRYIRINKFIELLHNLVRLFPEETFTHVFSKRYYEKYKDKLARMTSYSTDFDYVDFDHPSYGGVF